MPGLDVETLQCFAGHAWTRPHTRGGKPTACPEHIRYLNEPISPRLKPPRRIVDLWEETAVLDEPAQYVKRWTKAWERAVRIVAAQEKSFAKVDVELIEEYIQHKRLSELHRAYAEYNPYQETAQRSIKPHPGWYQSQVEASLARRSAMTLGLEPDPSEREAPGGDIPGDDYSVYDDQLGPDGKPL